MRTIAVANQKGGCGKTTTSINLACALALAGDRVLIIDLDSQGHTTLGLGMVPDSFEKTVYDVFSSSIKDDIEDSIYDTDVENLSIIPANILLSGLEFELAVKYGREFVLKQKLETVTDDYDFCIIDCSPSLCLLTLNALVASEEVIVPVQAQYYAIEGLKQLLESIELTTQRFNTSLNILGILITFVDKRTKLSTQIISQMREYFGSLVFDTVIHRTVKLAEAPSAGESLLTYAPESNGAKEYTKLAQEVCERNICVKETV